MTSVISSNVEATKAENPTFEETFNERINQIDRRAKAIGSTLSGVCQKAGAGIVTPYRWRRRAPKTIALVDKMESVLGEMEREAAPQAAQ